MLSLIVGTKFSESAGSMRIIESDGSMLTVDVKSGSRPKLAEKTQQLWDYVTEVSSV